MQNEAGEEYEGVDGEPRGKDQSRQAEARECAERVHQKQRENGEELGAAVQ